MGDLELSENIETDNIPWRDSKELVLYPKDLELTSYSSEEDEIDTKSTVSLNDLQQDFPKNHVETTIGQVNFSGCNDVHVGNKKYYHGDVTIKQYVLNATDAVKVLPSQSDVKGNLTFTEEGFPAITGCENEGNTNKTLKSFLASLKCRHLWYAVFILFLVTGIAVTMTMLIPTKTEEDFDSDVSKNTSLILYTREEWGAVKPRGEVAALEQNPPHYVIIAHTAGRNCSTFPLCAQAVRDTQMDHMGRGWEDLGMHFLVGGDGGAYTGLGWGKHGAHTIPFNRRSIAIYFIGNFMFDLPPKRQIKAAKLLIEEGVKLGKIATNYKLYAHKQVWATESPGAALIEDIKTWPHWSAYESSDE